MSKRGFWDHYPQKYWVEADWAAWDKAGRPRVPSAMRLSSERPTKPGLDQVSVVEPPHLADAFDLYAKPSKGNARSRGVDALLEKMLGRR